MDLAYYPGCTLYEKAKDLDQNARDIASAFGFSLKDLPDWTCCGAVFANNGHNIMKLAGPYRMLSEAEKISDTLVTLCSACYNVMKRTNNLVMENKDIREKLQLFTEKPYSGSLKVIHYLEFLRDFVTYETLSTRVVEKQSRSISPYYGCLMLRPYDQLKLDDPENPVMLSEVITAIADIPVEIPSHNECCGAYLATNDKSGDLESAALIAREASEQGSDMIVTSCPMCFYNLDKTQEIQVTYFTEYLATALGVNTSVRSAAE